VADIAVTVASGEVPVVDRAATVTASVTNAGPGPERVVLRAFRPAAAGAAPPGEPDWATVDRPLRDVAPGATEQYVVALAVPSAVPAGTYELKLVAHPADAAPEEYAERGPVLRVAVPAEPPPPARRRPWWAWAVAGALLLGVAAVGVVLLRPTAGTVAVPDVVGLAEAQAEAALADVGLVADADPRLGPRPFGAVIRQVPEPGTRLSEGSDVVLVVSRGLPLAGLEGLPLNDALALVGALAGEDVAGLPVAEAEAALADELDLDVRYSIVAAPVGRVVQASAPDSGDGQVAQGERLVLVVATRLDIGDLDDLVVAVPDRGLLDRILGGLGGGG
jgi:hypothetical protein